MNVRFFIFICFIFGCVFLNSFAQNLTDNGYLATTIYEIGEEENEIEKQTLAYSIKNGKLHIEGYMFTNCCGLHVLNSLQDENTIFLSRSDMGLLCDCEGFHFVNIDIVLYGESSDKYYEQENGTIGINHMEMIPILIQAINNLNADGKVIGTKRVITKLVTV